MEPWILFTFGAASAQTLRFMLQKRLASGTLSATGATYARFVYSVTSAANRGPNTCRSELDRKPDVRFSELDRKPDVRFRPERATGV